MTTRRKTLGRSVLALAAACAVAAGAWWWFGHRRFEVTDNAYLKADSAVIAPRIEGYVARIEVRENQQVRRGEPLGVLDRRNYAAKLAEASAAISARTAQVAGDEAALASLDAQLRRQRSVVAQMAAGLEVAQAEADRANLDFQRYRTLAATNVASAQRLEAVTSDSLKAGAELRRAQASPETEQLRVPMLESDRHKEARLQQSRAELGQAQAARDLAEIDLQDTEMRAPFDGILGNLSARVGQYVRPGSVLLTVVPEDLYLVANDKETQVSAMRPGQCASLTIDALPDLRLDGRVESFAPATGAVFSILPPENATGNFTKIVQRVPVRIRIGAPPEIRPPAASARYRAGRLGGPRPDRSADGRRTEGRRPDAIRSAGVLGAPKAPTKREAPLTVDVIRRRGVVRVDEADSRSPPPRSSAPRASTT